jgi:hypothetical protein
MTCARAGKHGSNPDLSTAVCSQQEKLPAPSKAVRSTWTAQHRAHTMQTMLLLSTTARSAMHAHALHSPGNVSTAALWGGSTYTFSACYVHACAAPHANATNPQNSRTTQQAVSMTAKLSSKVSRLACGVQPHVHLPPPTPRSTSTLTHATQSLHSQCCFTLTVQDASHKAK